MATTESNALEIQTLKTQVAELLSKSVLPTNMTAAQKRVMIEGVFPNGVWIDINDPNLKVGDKVAGKKAGINDGVDFMGYVLTAPPTQDSHINFVIKF